MIAKMQYVWYNEKNDEVGDLMKIKKISTVQDLEQLAQRPSGGYALMADIDMDGQTWTPVDFSGVLQGNGYTISNCRIKNEEGRVETGFFGRLSGQVRDRIFGKQMFAQAGRNTPVCWRV